MECDTACYRIGDAMNVTPRSSVNDETRPSGVIEKLAHTLVGLSERWFPDAYVFVVAACAIVGVAVYLHGGSAVQISQAFGDGFWSIIPFTMQMAVVAITGYVLSMSPPMAKMLTRIAAIPSTGRGAVVLVAVVSIALALLNWGVSLIFSGLLVREIARRSDLRFDYRAAGAAAYLGLGWTCTMGMSSPSAQFQATSASIPSSLLPITGVIPFTHTILTWQNGVMIVTATLLSVIVCYFTTPPDAKVKTAQQLGVDLESDKSVPEKRVRPGDYMEFSPFLTVVVVVISAGWLWNTFSSGNPLLKLSQLNTYNFVFLILGLLLHWRPRSFLNSFGKAMPSVSGVLLQFPFYGGVGFMLTKVVDAHGKSLSDVIAHWFVSMAHDSQAFAVLVGVYSAVLGFFIPSAGGKWIIEAPYVMTAANHLGAHLGWTVMVYNVAETLPNFINPFWMLPLLGILALKAKDLIGYTSLQFIVHAPVMIIVAALLMPTFAYVPPIAP